MGNLNPVVLFTWRYKAENYFVMGDFRISCGNKFNLFFLLTFDTKPKVVIITVMIFSLFIWLCVFFRTLNLWWTPNLNTHVHSSFLIQLTDTWQFTCLPGLFSPLRLRCSSASNLTSRLHSKEKHKNWFCMSVLRCDGFTEMWGIQKGTSFLNVES